MAAPRRRSRPLDIPYILAALDLSPADTATLGQPDVVAILTEQGGPTSHTAILARSLGLPAVVACPGATAVPDGTLVVLDGSTGLVELEPDEERRTAVRRELMRPPVSAATGPGRTRDGHPVALLANIGTVADAERAMTYDGEGVGLFRTEFLFLNRRDRPGVAEQAEIYRRVFGLFGDRSVTVRTLAFLPRPQCLEMAFAARAATSATGAREAALALADPNGR